MSGEDGGIHNRSPPLPSFPPPFFKRCFYDADNGKVHFSVNGEQFPTAFSLPNRPALFPAVVLKNAEVFSLPPSLSLLSLSPSFSQFIPTSPPPFPPLPLRCLSILEPLPLNFLQGEGSRGWWEGRGKGW